MELSFDFLYWLLEDYKNPDQFAKKLAITKESFANRLKHENPKMVVEFVENIAIAIQRIENSKEFRSTWRCIFTPECVENFIVFRIVKLFLAGQLSSVTIELLKACNVFSQNTMFQTLMREIVHNVGTARDASDVGADLSQTKPTPMDMPRTMEARKNLKKRRQRYEQIYKLEQQSPSEADLNNITAHFLLWMLEDFEEPEMFACKLALTPNAISGLLKNSKQTISSGFAENIAIAIWRIENSKNYMTQWHDKLHGYVNAFVSNHIARLQLKNQMTLKTIRKLKGCRLIRENCYFRRLLGLPPL